MECSQVNKRLGRMRSWEFAQEKEASVSNMLALSISLEKKQESKQRMQLKRKFNMA